ncbi:MAG: DUF6320 domain-containing protein [Proteocatella sp.]
MMNHCDKCNIKILNKSSKCPLCGNKLKNIDQNFIEPYPKIEIEGKHYQLIRFKIYVFLSIIMFFMTISIKFLSEKDLTYLFLSTSVLGYIWFTIYTIQKSLKNIGFFILKQMLSISAIVIFIDYALGYQKWSISYAIPAIIILGVSSISSIAVFKPMQFREYFVYQITISIVGILSILLVIFSLSTVRWTLIFAAFYSAMVMLGMIIFADKKAKLEFKKRFHL